MTTILYLLSSLVCVMALSKYGTQRVINACPSECVCDSNTVPGAACKAVPQRLHPKIKFLQIEAHINKITKQILQPFEEIEFLYLSGCRITTIESGAFSGMTELYVLDLSNNSLTEIQSDAFKHLVQLEGLYLQHNKLTTFNLILPPQLINMDVSSNRLKSVDLDFSETNLKSLDLCENQIEKIKFEVRHSRIESLCLQGTKFTDLSDIGKLRTLQELTLVKVHLQSLNFLVHMDSLKNLTMNNVTLQSQASIKVLQSLSEIKSLNIDYSPQLVQPIFDLTTLVFQLQHFSLQYTYLETLTEQYVPDNKHFNIDISNNPLSCDCYMYWVKTRHLQNEQFPLSNEETKCTKPHVGEPILQRLTNLNCYDDNKEKKLIQSTDTYTAETSTDHDSTEYNGYTETNGYHYSTEYNNYYGSTEPHMQNQHKDSGHSTLYIALGCVLALLVIIGIILVVTLIIIKKRRKFHVSPDKEETQMQAQEQIKQTSSQDTLLKK